MMLFFSEKENQDFPEEIQLKKRGFLLFFFNALFLYLIIINSKINNLAYHVGKFL